MLHCHPSGVPGLLGDIRAHRQIQIRTKNKRPAPIGHGAIRIESCRFLEGAKGLQMIESVGELESLVEEYLCSIRFCRYWVVMLTEAF